MRRMTWLLLSLVLACTMAVAQANSQPQSTASQHPQATATQANRADQNGSRANQGTQPDQSTTAASQDQGASSANAPAASPQQSPDQTTAPRRANTNGGGVPWGWIIVGIIVIAIILALIGRGSGDPEVVRREREIERDRTLGPTEVERRRDDDDIRRVG